MSDKNLITRLVVGTPQMVILGRPAGQRLGDTSGTGLRWKAGKWVAARSARQFWFRSLFALPERATIELQPRRAGGHSDAATLGAARSGAGPHFGTMFLAAAGAFAAVLLVSLALAQLWQQRDAVPAVPARLPIAQALDTPQVRVVEDTYVPEQLAQPPGADQAPVPSDETATVQPEAEQTVGQLPIAAPADQGPLPVAPLVKPAQQQPKVARASAPPVAPRSAPKPAPAARSQQQTVPAAVQVAPPKAPAASEQRVPAVVFDEANQQAPRPQGQPSPATSKVADPRTSSQAPPEQVARQPQRAPSPRFAQPVKDVPVGASGAVARPQSSAGLIAITPDGKTAVFTNPTTKLPQPFKIGEQLPSGETIRSIDANAGKVATSAKEYSLD